ncbi:MAG: DUF2764 domain-containing protein [Bacteroidales bacterium]|nr:DUF2764 domain-containing protein [Bacteroidales bacterium]
MNIFKNKYYCLVAGLPDILIDDTKLAESGYVFKTELKQQLHPSDYKLVELLFLHYDNENLINQLLKQNKHFNNYGKYSEVELEEQIKEPTYIADYMKQFISSYKTETPIYPNLCWENQFQSLFYDYVLQTENDLLKLWFKFDLNLKNILTAINCHRYNYDLEKQLIPVKHKNEVYENLKKGIPKTDLLADEVPYVDRILHFAEPDMETLEKEKGIDNIKWMFLDDHTFFNYFTIEKILSFVIKLGIVERWISLDDETGRKFFEKLLNDLETSYEFSEEFGIK